MELRPVYSLVRLAGLLTLSLSVCNAVGPAREQPKPASGLQRQRSVRIGSSSPSPSPQQESSSSPSHASPTTPGPRDHAPSTIAENPKPRSGRSPRSPGGGKVRDSQTGTSHQTSSHAARSTDRSRRQSAESRPTPSNAFSRQASGSNPLLLDAMTHEQIAHMLAKGGSSKGSQASLPSGRTLSPISSRSSEGRRSSDLAHLRSKLSTGSITDLKALPEKPTPAQLHRMESAQSAPSRIRIKPLERRPTGARQGRSSKPGTPPGEHAAGSSTRPPVRPHAQSHAGMASPFQQTGAQGPRERRRGVERLSPLGPTFEGHSGSGSQKSPSSIHSSRSPSIEGMPLHELNHPGSPEPLARRQKSENPNRRVEKWLASSPSPGSMEWQPPVPEGSQAGASQRQSSGADKGKKAIKEKEKEKEKSSKEAPPSPIARQDSGTQAEDSKGKPPTDAGQSKHKSKVEGPAAPPSPKPAPIDSSGAFGSSILGSYHSSLHHSNPLLTIPTQPRPPTQPRAQAGPQPWPLPQAQTSAQRPPQSPPRSGQTLTRQPPIQQVLQKSKEAKKGGNGGSEGPRARTGDPAKALAWTRTRESIEKAAGQGQSPSP